jgi:hypothetical protein
LRGQNVDGKIVKKRKKAKKVRKSVNSGLRIRIAGDSVSAPGSPHAERQAEGTEDLYQTELIL